LTPPAAFWAINSIAVDYSADAPVQSQNLDAIKALDDSGTDVRSVLKLEDQNYHIMPRIGNQTDLTFQSPPHLSGRERTVLAKVSGYYDIHLEAKGDPQMTILSRFLSEPGFGSRFGLNEYMKWKKESEEKNRNK